MSALGHKRTLGRVEPMSAITPKANIRADVVDVRYVPLATKVQCSKKRRYSITSSARVSSVGGIARPRALTTVAQCRPALVTSHRLSITMVVATVAIATVAIATVAIATVVATTIGPPRRHPSTPIRHVGFGLIL